MDTNASGYRLPTEAEWEYACRAGTTTPFNWEAESIDGSQANYNASKIDSYNTAAGTYWGRTTAVDSYAPNAWGIYDMRGNVWEMCWDWYAADYGGLENVTDPAGAVSGDRRVARGGSLQSGGQELRSAYRNGSTPSDRYFNAGFRLVRGAIREE
jgi:formylglycine-generating enzyme required for sulfatase activity